MKYYIMPFFLLWISCATPGPLTGGEQDTTAPKIIKSNIDSLQLNIKPSKIILSFDEYIVDNNLQQNIIITPLFPCETEQKIIKNKHLQITIPCDLDSNTTYTVNLINAIKDNNEGNLLTFYSLTFSTGNYIDSNTIKGIVMDPYNNTPVEKAIVALYYLETTDSTPLTQKPTYVTKTNEAGEFKIPFLPINTYKLIAFLDENKNLLINSGEMVSNLYKVNSIDTLHYNIPISTLHLDKKLDIQCIGKDYKQQLVFNQSMDNPFKLEYNNEPINFTKNKTADTITFFLPKINPSDTIFYIYDTIIKPVKINKINISNNDIETVTTVDTNEINIQFRAPLVSFSKPGLTLKLDDTTFIDYNLKQIDNFTLNIKTVQSSPFIIDIDTTFTIDIYDRSNKPFNTTITPPSPSETILTLTINNIDTTDKPKIIEIYSDKKILFTQHINTDTIIQLTTIPAGKYNIRAYIDQDQNQRWSQANFLKKSPSEPLIHFTPFELRANWDTNLELKLENFK
jgi:hypothetical protein